MLFQWGEMSSTGVGWSRAKDRNTCDEDPRESSIQICDEWVNGKGEEEHTWYVTLSQGKSEILDTLALNVVHHNNREIVLVEILETIYNFLTDSFLFQNKKNQGAPKLHQFLLLSRAVYLDFFSCPSNCVWKTSPTLPHN